MTYTYCSRSFIPISLNILRKLASDDIIDEFFLQYKEIHKINIDFKHRNDKEELKKLRDKLIVSSNYNLLIDYLNDLSTFYKLLDDKRFDGLINCIIKLRWRIGRNYSDVTVPATIGGATMLNDKKK